MHLVSSEYPGGEKRRTGRTRQRTLASSSPVSSFGAVFTQHPHTFRYSFRHTTHMSLVFFLMHEANSQDGDENVRRNGGNSHSACLTLRVRESFPPHIPSQKDEHTHACTHLSCFSTTTTASGTEYRRRCCFWVTTMLISTTA